MPMQLVLAYWQWTVHAGNVPWEGLQVKNEFAEGGQTVLC